MHEEGNTMRKLMVVVAAVLCGSFLFAADFEKLARAAKEAVQGVKAAFSGSEQEE